ncbi:TRAP transporter large permease [Pseudogracilibacillus auburnensis]|uniref:Tripartite ATP-independent transporter DctM subunit n=1 Tax=Pseudogracilibacillus auburnensis TaxID=1494959 RepID=A0A2V3VZD5_9BACI|nr:TRAP transporter large permease [Pseudogracilibacillus auburnensis]MBO1002100.1 TRAP transporter large permease [Pseudogracilibacillus auburnensis]PXW87423.1 tripartite ATP-independent transporter DctM subunit [Pseudogracilibacillus auburnensis]
MLWLIIALLFVMLFLNFPIMIVLLVSALLMMIVFAPDVSFVIFVQQLSSSVESYVLLAIPMFIFAADIIVEGRTANRLLDFVKDLFGHIRGGTGIVAAATSTMFGSVSGSAQATIAAIGRPMRNRALEYGYKDSHIIGLIINSAGIAILIPPSIVMIYYGMLTGTSVGDLFIAGIIPGLMVFVGFALWEFFIAIKKDIPVEPKATWGQRWYSFRKALLTFGFPVLILGGIYTGMFSPTEAAAFSVLYAMLLELVIYRSIKIKDIYRIAVSTGVVTSIVFILLAAGGAFSWIISYLRIPQMLTETFLGNDPTQLQILLIMSLFFLISCMFVDSLVAIAILTPIFFPIAMAADIHPVAIGILITMQATLGTVTPPFGVNIFTACAIFKKPYLEVVRGIAPYIIIFLAINLLLIIYPEIIMVYQDIFGSSKGG